MGGREDQHGGAISGLMTLWKAAAAGWLAVVSLVGRRLRPAFPDDVAVCAMPRRRAANRLDTAPADRAFWSLVTGVVGRL